MAEVTPTFVMALTLELLDDRSQPPRVLTPPPASVFTRIGTNS
jgi:hypothetical protein